MLIPHPHASLLHHTFNLIVEVALQRRHLGRVVNLELDLIELFGPQLHSVSEDLELHNVIKCRLKLFFAD